MTRIRVPTRLLLPAFPQHQGEATALPVLTAHRDMAADYPGEFLAEVQPQSGTFGAPCAWSIQPGKSLEQSCLIFRGNADSRVADQEFSRGRFVLPLLPNLQTNKPSFREFDGIVGQIDQDLTEPSPIPHDPPAALAHPHSVPHP